ncbi:THUMP domain-containing protein 1 [Plakobranchus ocellatus]|uniref:THUMP domain-containing protein 1 n=1 Tax=Plakobranchus ocellatus TaxID=259542 RepID=A0AAV4DV43_9GAST|nr:THUMP domain-containing protein 1 [Plakobranchus ocellatus]
MASDNSTRGKKRSKSFYRKSAYGGKRHCTGRNVLEPGIQGFLVMCHSNESNAVRESYNILNEYADHLYGPDKTKPTEDQTASTECEESVGESDEDCEDIEKALEKEVDGMKNIAPTEKRFQNIATKAKNLIFIRTTLQDPVKVVTTIMEDIAQRKLKRARYAARMLPIVGTCKAQTAAIAELAKSALEPFFAKENPDAPSSFTVMYKSRNNNGTTCGKESVIRAVKKEIFSINPDVKLSWYEYDVAILVEIVCTVCCLCLAPQYNRLRKFNFQELAQGPKMLKSEQDCDSGELKVELINNEQVDCKINTSEDPANETAENVSTLVVGNQELANDKPDMKETLVTEIAHENERAHVEGTS